MATNLDLGVAFVTVFGSTITCITILQRKFTVNFFRKLLSFDLFSFLLIIYISVKMVPSNWKLITWDEFPSWGANAKALNMDRHFYTLGSSNSNIANGFFQNYPPGSAVYHYFSTRIFGWSEGNLLRIQVLITLIGFCVALESINRIRRFPSVILIGLVPIIFYYYILKFNLNSILGDGLLGVYFTVALVMVAFYSSKDLHLRQLLYLLPVVGAMSIIKPTGIFFSFLTVIILLFKTSFSIQFATANRERFRFLPKVTWTNRLYASICFASAIGPQIFWNIYLSYHQINKATLKGDFSDVAGANRIIETFNTFAKQFTEFRSYEKIQGNALMLVMLLFLASYFLAKHRLMDYLEIKILKSLVIGFFIYATFIFTLYLFFMDEFERKTGNSILRYLNSYILAWTIVVILYLITIIRSTSIIRFVAVFFIILNMGILTQTKIGSELQGFDTNSDKFKVRTSVDDVTEKFLLLTNNFDKAYVIDQGSTGLKPKIFSYNLMPKQVNLGCWSFGKPLFMGDIWTCDLKLSNQLMGYEYLVVFESKFQLPSDGLLPNEQNISPGVYKIFSYKKLVYRIQLVAPLN
jgi:hypothetical protein